METWIDEPCPVDHDADEAEVARAAGLRYVEVGALGGERRRCGRGFTYVDERGDVLRDAARERCEALVIPPAWTEVRICGHDDGHLLATGRDDAGRKQYLYHPAWREMRDRQKFARLGLFGDRLTRVRKRVRTDLRKDELTLDRAAAEALGNTRAVARSSYVAPQVVAAATSGELQELWASSRTSRWMSRAEQTCRKVLAP